MCLSLLIACLAASVSSASGIFERDDEEEERSEPVVVEVPDWVQSIIDDDYAALYPGPDGGGYIGTGVGTTRREAQSAAAVDFAGNVSTVVTSDIVEQIEESDDGEDRLSVVIESEVRSQAIVSGLDPLIWEDPRTDLVYALYRATVEEYERKLREWVITMESLSEAEQRREMQRLEEERAAAERRLEEIKLEELQQQLREADRRMRAARYAPFLSQSLPQRELGLPTGYINSGLGVSGTIRGERGDTAFDAGVDLGILEIVQLSGSVTGLRRDSDDQQRGQVSGRFLVDLLRRVGWVTNTTVGLGVWAGNAFVDDEFDDGAGGAFVFADVLIPEWANTRYSLYAGNDLINARAMWYPFWNTIESAVGLRAAAQVEVTDPGYTDGARDGSYLGLGVVFAPIDGGFISIDTRNFSTLSGTITLAF
jgi:hypothetical protein